MSPASLMVGETKRRGGPRNWRLRASDPSAGIAATLLAPATRDSQ